MFGISSMDFSSLCGLGENMDLPTAQTTLYEFAYAQASLFTKALVVAGRSALNDAVRSIYAAGFAMTQDSNPPNKVALSEIVNAASASIPEAIKDSVGGYFEKLSAQGYSFVRANVSSVPAAVTPANTRAVTNSAPLVSSAPFPIQPIQDRKIEYRSAPKKSSPKDRQKLILYLGIGAVIFAISMGILAAKSGD